MKAADTRSTAVAARSNAAFFSKEAGASFFTSTQPETDFFSKSSTTGNKIQRKSAGNLNIVPPKNNIITPIQAKCSECEEKEKLSRKEDADGEELDVQTRPISDNPPSILKLEDEKSKEEEKIQNKDEDKVKVEDKDAETDKLLRKPDNTPDLQSKCAECEDEEKVKKKDELKERSEEHTSELQSQSNLVCRLLLEKK